MAAYKYELENLNTSAKMEKDGPERNRYAGDARSKSPSYSNEGNTSITKVLLGASTTVDHNSIINWLRRGNAMLNDNPGEPATSAAIRGYARGDVLHSRPAVANYSRNVDDIVVFYVLSSARSASVRS